MARVSDPDVLLVIDAARALLDELRLLNLSARIALPEREALRAALAALDGDDAP